MEKELGASIKIARAAGRTQVTVCYSPVVAEALKAALNPSSTRSREYYRLVAVGEEQKGEDSDLTRVYVSRGDDWRDRLGSQGFFSDGSVGYSSSSGAVNLCGLLPEAAIQNPGTPVTIWWAALDGRSFEDVKGWLTQAKEALRLFVAEATKSWSCETTVYIIRTEPTL